MKGIRLVGLALGVLVIGAWLVTGVTFQGARPSDERVGPGRAAPVPPDPLSSRLQIQMARLDQYVRAPRPLAPSVRNPFRFAERQIQVPPATPWRPPALTTAGLAHASRPAFRLVGIAEDPGANGPVRTAMLSGLDQLFFAKEGDRILGRYVVLRIAADAVQVKDGEDGEPFTLTLK